MYTGDPINNPVDAIRLEVGDTDADDVWLTDNDYLYYIQKYPNNTRAIVNAAAQGILFKLTRYTRERAGQIDVYGAEAYKNYKDALLLKLKDFSFNGVRPISFFGGINRQESADNFLDPSLVDQPFYRGQQNESPEWWDKRNVDGSGQTVEPLDYPASHTANYDWDVINGSSS